LHPGARSGAINERINSKYQKRAPAKARARCGRTLIMGRRVVYRSQPGFHGTDYVVYPYVSERGNKAWAHVFIAVR
jgi:hypothetical protein